MQILFLGIFKLLIAIAEEKHLKLKAPFIFSS